MKNLLCICVVGTLFFFSSCKKDYTCQCTDANGNVTTTTLHHTYKADANSVCVTNGPNCKLN